MKYYGYNVNGKPVLFAGGNCVGQEGEDFYSIRPNGAQVDLGPNFVNVFSSAIRDRTWLPFDDNPLAPKFKGFELLKTGGAWLGQARTWLQWNFRRGDSITWGSDEVITITVRQFEEAAADIAAAAKNEYIQQELLKNAIKP